MVGFTAIVGFLATGGRKLPLLLPRWLWLWFALAFRFPCESGFFSATGGNWCKLLGLKQFLHSPGFQTCSVKVLQADIFPELCVWGRAAQCMVGVSSMGLRSAHVARTLPRAVTMLQEHQTEREWEWGKICLIIIFSTLGTVWKDQVAFCWRLHSFYINLQNYITEMQNQIATIILLIHKELKLWQLSLMLQKAERRKMAMTENLE